MTGDEHRESIIALSGDQDTRKVQGEFGPNLIFFLRPFARVYLRDEDPSLKGCTPSGCAQFCAHPTSKTIADRSSRGGA